MTNKRVQLVNSPLSSHYLGSSRAGAYPPLNLLSLATYLVENKVKCEIDILDGEILSCEDIMSRLSADIVGISANILSYSTAIEIAKAAKEKGARVILGGHFSSALPKAILKNEQFIDAVVVGDGEKALLQYIKGDKPETICNLAYRKNGDLFINPTEILSLNKLPSPNFGLLDLGPYFRNYRNNYSHKPFIRPSAIYSSKGCLWRSRTGGCVYCGIQNKGWRTREPKFVWQEIEQLVKTCGVDFLWDVSDTITSSKEWLKEFAHYKPLDINPAFHLYGRADQIDFEVAELLSRINCYELFMGVESGDEGCLIKSNKGFKPKEILKAVEILIKHEINIILSFLIGLPEESEKSIEKTLILIESIMRIMPIQEAFVNIVLPLPGSKIFDMILAHSKLGPKYKDIDIFTLEELRKDWIENFTYISYEQANRFQNQMLGYFPIASSFGKPK